MNAHSDLILPSVVAIVGLLTTLGTTLGGYLLRRPQFAALNKRLDGIDHRLDAIDHRLDRVEDRLLAIKGKQAVQGDRLANLEGATRS